MIFIKNGTINTITNGIIKGDILVENKKIKAIGENLEVPQDAKIIDAEGKLVFPGIYRCTYSFRFMGRWYGI